MNLLLPCIARRLGLQELFLLALSQPRAELSADGGRRTTAELGDASFGVRAVMTRHPSIEETHERVQCTDQPQKAAHGSTHGSCFVCHRGAGRDAA